MDDTAIKEAVHASIAKTILDGLDTEARDAILQKSISDSIGGYTFRKKWRRLLLTKPGKSSRSWSNQVEWETKITDAIRGGLTITWQISAPPCRA